VFLWYGSQDDILTEHGKGLTSDLCVVILLKVMNGPGGLPAASYLCQLPDIPGKFLLHKVMLSSCLKVPASALFCWMCLIAGGD
jgi:hypothetical protein